MGIILAILASFLFGLANVLIAVTGSSAEINQYEGLLITLVINNIVNLVALPLILLFSPLPQYSLVGIASFIGSGVFSSFLGRLLIYCSIGLVGASRAGAVKITTPLFTLLIGLTLLQEKLSTFGLSGIFTVIAGVFLITRETPKLIAGEAGRCSSPLGDAAVEASAPPHMRHKAGIALGLLSGLSFALGNVLNKVGLNNYPSPLLGSVIGSGVSLLAYAVSLNKILPAGVSCRKISYLLKAPGSKTYIQVGVVTSFALYSLYFSLAYLPVSIVNTLVSTEALFTVALAWLILKKKEALTARLIIGTAVITGGVILIVL